MVEKISIFLACFLIPTIGFYNRLKTTKKANINIFFGIRKNQYSMLWVSRMHGSCSLPAEIHMCRLKCLDVGLDIAECEGRVL